MKTYYALFIFAAFLTLTGASLGDTVAGAGVKPGSGCGAPPAATVQEEWSVISLPDTEENRDAVNACLTQNPKLKSSAEDAEGFLLCAGNIKGYEINTVSDKSEFTASPGCSLSGTRFTTGGQSSGGNAPSRCAMMDYDCLRAQAVAQSKHTYALQYCPTTVSP